MSMFVMEKRGGRKRNAAVSYTRRSWMHAIPQLVEYSDGWETCTHLEGERWAVDWGNTYRQLDRGRISGPGRERERDTHTHTHKRSYTCATTFFFLSSFFVTTVVALGLGLAGTEASLRLHYSNVSPRTD